MHTTLVRNLSLMRPMWMTSWVSKDTPQTKIHFHRSAQSWLLGLTTVRVQMRLHAYLSETNDAQSASQHSTSCNKTWHKYIYTCLYMVLPFQLSDRLPNPSRPAFLHFSAVFTRNSTHFEVIVFVRFLVEVLDGLRGRQIIHTYIYICILHTHTSKPKRCAGTR